MVTTEEPGPAGRLAHEAPSKVVIFEARRVPRPSRRHPVAREVRITARRRAQVASGAAPPTGRHVTVEPVADLVPGNRARPCSWTPFPDPEKGEFYKER